MTKILIADGGKTPAALYKQEFENEGYEVRLATDEHNAVAEITNDALNQNAASGSRTWNLRHAVLVIAMVVFSVLSRDLQTAFSAEGSGSGQEAAHEGTIAWQKWNDKVVALVKKEGKLILVDVYADWCGPCKMMDRNTYEDPSVVRKMKRYIAVKVNVDNDREAATRFSTGPVPTTVILDSNGNPLLTQSGYFPRNDFWACLPALKNM